MNIEIYKYIAAELCIAIDKSYKKGIKSIAGKTKETLQFSMKYATNPLIDISYTDVDLAMISNFKVEAFTVAGVMSYELEEKLKKLAVEIQSGKHPLAEGETDIKKVWKDEAMNILADYIPVADMPPPSYLQTNLQTAINSSYHGSRWQRLQDPNIKNLYPAYQYKTRKDGRVRPEHVTLDDKIFQNEDPIWSRIIPPNGWNCRCYFTPLTSEEIQSSNSPLEPISDEVALKRIIKQAGISKDFDRNPGEVRSIWGKWLQSNLSGKNYDNISDEIVKSGFRMPTWEAIEPFLKDKSEAPELIEYNEENYKTLFGDFPGKVETKLGEYKFGNDFYEKLGRRDEGKRKKYLGLIKPTLTNSDFIFVDKESGTLFVKSFLLNEKNIIYVGVLKIPSKGTEELIISFHEKENIIKKVNEGKFLLDHSFPRVPGNTGGMGKFTHDAGRVNLNKLIFSDIIKNTNINNLIVDELSFEVLSNPNEIWGSTFNYNSVTNSEMNYIRYRVEGFELVKVKNNEAYDYKTYDYSEINTYRKGVLLL